MHTHQHIKYMCKLHLTDVQVGYSQMPTSEGEIGFNFLPSPYDKLNWGYGYRKWWATWTAFSDEGEFSLISTQEEELNPTSMLSLSTLLYFPPYKGMPTIDSVSGGRKNPHCTWKYFCSWGEIQTCLSMSCIVIESVCMYIQISNSPPFLLLSLCSHSVWYFANNKQSKAFQVNKSRTFNCHLLGLWRSFWITTQYAECS